MEVVLLHQHIILVSLWRWFVYINGTATLVVVALELQHAVPGSVKVGLQLSDLFLLLIQSDLDLHQDLVLLLDLLNLLLDDTIALNDLLHF